MKNFLRKTGVEIIRGYVRLTVFNGHISLMRYVIGGLSSSLIMSDSMIDSMIDSV